MKKEEFPEYNIHKLLRIVWVYVEHKDSGRKVEQGELPRELAKQLTPSLSDDELDEKVNMEKEIEGKLTANHALRALEQLNEILNTPWPFSNPCPGARPKYRH
jgi:hypothetical protein